MKFALVFDGVVREYRDYPVLPPCKKVNDVPVLRPVVEVPGPAVDGDLYKINREVTVFDDRVEHSYVATPVDLAMAKTIQRGRINAARDAEEASGFDYLGARFDSDDASVKRLTVAVLAAQNAPANFTIDWTTATGSVVTLTKGQLIAMPAVMATRGNDIHTKARAKKAQIDAATTVDEVAAVAW